jgi:hypothetical protein
MRNSYMIAGGKSEWRDDRKDLVIEGEIKLERVLRKLDRICEVNASDSDLGPVAGPF